MKKTVRVFILTLLCNIVLAAPSYAGTTGSDPKPGSAITLHYLIPLELLISIAWPY